MNNFSGKVSTIPRPKLENRPKSEFQLIWRYTNGDSEKENY